MTTVSLTDVATEGDLYVANEWTDVNDSEVIESVGVNYLTGQLFVGIGGKIYVYNVDSQLSGYFPGGTRGLYENFVNATSKGYFYSSYIKPFGPSVDVIYEDDLVTSPVPEEAQQSTPQVVDVSASEKVVMDFLTGPLEPIPDGSADQLFRINFTIEYSDVVMAENLENAVELAATSARHHTGDTGSAAEVKSVAAQKVDNG